MKPYEIWRNKVYKDCVKILALEKHEHNHKKGVIIECVRYRYVAEPDLTGFETREEFWRKHEKVCD